MGNKFVVIIDYGMGNVGSVKNALDFLNIKSSVSDSPKDIKKASHLILPGVGAFAEGMKNLKKRDLIRIMKEAVFSDKKPFLGVCLGMQLLADIGEEDGINEGLGFINGRAIKIKVEKGMHLSHVGWNDVKLSAPNPLFTDVDPLIFYFVHSYHLEPNNKSLIIAYCDYGVKFAAAVRNENIFGVQFHPERSQKAGIKIYENFLNFDA